MISPDSAVEMNTGIGSSGEPGGAKAQKRTISILCIVLGFGMATQAFAKALELAVRY
jgi:hypothetical protein